MKEIGEINGVPVYSDPNVPKNTMYMLNTDSFIGGFHIKTSRWQLLKNWVKNLFRSHK